MDKTTSKKLIQANVYTSKIEGIKNHNPLNQAIGLHQ